MPAEDINQAYCTSLLPDTTWPPTSLRASPTVNPLRPDEAEDLLVQAAKFR